MTTDGSAPPVTAPMEPDWTDQVTDLVVDLVDSAREKTTGPILTASRGVVYGVVILIVATLLGIVAVILGGRIISLVPLPEFVSYAIVGALLLGIGFVLWTKRDAS